jgi:hypothetical protein
MLKKNKINDQTCNFAFFFSSNRINLGDQFYGSIVRSNEIQTKFCKDLLLLSLYQLFVRFMSFLFYLSAIYNGHYKNEIF